MSEDRAEYDRETQRSRQPTKHLLGTMSVVSAVAAVIFSYLDAMTLSQAGAGIAVTAALLAIVLPTGGEADD